MHNDRNGYGSENGGSSGGSQDDVERVVAHLGQAFNENIFKGFYLLVRLRFMVWVYQIVAGILLPWYAMKEKVLGAQERAEAAGHRILLGRETSRLQIERTRDLGLLGPGSASAALLPGAQQEPPISPYIPDEKVQEMALRAFLQIPAGDGPDAREAWRRCRQDLHASHSPAVAREVERLILEHRQRAGHKPLGNSVGQSMGH